MNKIIESCQYLLYNFPEASLGLEYINSRVSKETQEVFQFGYFPNIYNLSALTSLIGESILKENSLLYTRMIEDSLFPRIITSLYFEDFPLIFPFKDPYGNIHGFVGRTLFSETERKIKKIPKYKNSRNSKRFNKGKVLFGLYENKLEILNRNQVFIVEGQFDVIKSYEKGIRNVVALGSSSMTNYQFSIITRYTNNIVLLLDNDESGIKGRERIIRKFGKFANISNWYLPEQYKDIDECLCDKNINSLEDISFRIEV